MAKIGRVPTGPTPNAQLPSTPTQTESPGWLGTLGTMGGSVWDAVQGAGSAAGDAAVSVTDFLGGIDPMSMCLLAPMGNEPTPGGVGIPGSLFTDGVDPMSLCLLAPMIDQPAVCLSAVPRYDPPELCLGLEPTPNLDALMMPCLSLVPPPDCEPPGVEYGVDPMSMLPPDYAPGSITGVLDGVDPMSMCLLTALDPVQNAASSATSAMEGLFSGW